MGHLHATMAIAPVVIIQATQIKPVFHAVKVVQCVHLLTFVGHANLAGT